MKNNRNRRSLDLNKKAISRLNEETVSGGRAECSILVRNTEFCRSKLHDCPPEQPQDPEEDN
ncbi:hypothetical protein [Kordia sp.]|uniref:hypothetical protein n=1 Tax=Kordia sp. TaxID=1965332 RepID=UPI003D6C0417